MVIMSLMYIFIIVLNLVIVLFFIISNCIFKRDSNSIGVIKYLLPLSFVVVVVSILRLFNFPFYIQITFFLLIAIFSIYFLLKKYKQLFKKIQYQDYYFLILQLFVFNVGWAISYYLTKGTFVTGYYICNDPVNTAFLTKDLYNNLVSVNAAYPLGVFVLSSYFYNFFHLDIPVINFLVVLLIFSYLIYPVCYFIRLWGIRSKVLLFLLINCIFFSYLNTSFLYYGFFAQTASVPFIVSCIFMVFLLTKKVNASFLTSFVIIFSAAVCVYSFSVFPYVLFTLLLALLIYKRFRGFIFGLLNINYRYLILNILLLLPIFYFSYLFLSALFLSSNREASLSGVMGNLVGYLPIEQISGIWPFYDYRLSQSLTSLRSVVAIGFFVINFVLILYFISNKYFKKRKMIVVLLLSFSLLGLFLMVFTHSPYILAKFNQIAAVFFITISFIVLVQLYKKYKIKLIRVFLIGYGIMYGLLIILSSYLALKYIPVFTNKVKIDLLKVVELYKNKNKTYYGQNDWLLFYVDKNNTESINTHYQNNLFTKKNFKSDYLIFDSQQKEIIDFLINGKCLSYESRYFVVLDNSTKKCDFNKSNNIYGLYSYFLSKEFDGTTIISQDEEKFVNFNPNSNKSCSTFMKNDFGDIKIGYRKDAVGKLTDGVNVFLMSVSGEKGKNYYLTNDNNFIKISNSDYQNKKICFDIIGTSSYDWIILKNN